METVYYIYHIPGIKIGCSKIPTKRVKYQGYSEFEILEEHLDIHEASKREKALQRQYGYRVDRSDYSRVLMLSSIAGKNGGSVSGPKLVKSGHLARVGLIAVANGSPSKAGKANCAILRECPHCGKQGKGPTMFRYHFDNCKTIRELDRMENQSLQDPSYLDPYHL
jgi:hypothetical protein